MIRVNNDKRNVGVAGTGEGSEKHGYSENEASGNYSTVENGGPYTEHDHYNIASGNYSHAEGDCTHATATGSHSEGIYTQANGEHSHAEGSYNHAEGEASHGEGYQTKSVGAFSHSEGYLTVANGDYSHASGRGTETLTKGETVVGTYNELIDDCVFQVGTGTSVRNRETAFAVTKSGTVDINAYTDITRDVNIGSNASIMGGLFVNGSILNKEYYIMHSTLSDKHEIPIIQWNIGKYTKVSSNDSSSYSSECVPLKSPYIPSASSFATHNSVIASLYSDGALYITGVGDVPSDYFADKPPWFEYTEYITKCIIDTTVCFSNMDYWFSDCKNLQEISYIPPMVTSMEGTFYNCFSLYSCPTIPISTNVLVNTFNGCNSLSGTIDIEGNPKFFEGCFQEASLSDTLTINYTDSFTGIDDIISTKSTDSNIVKGTTHTRYIAKWNIGANNDNTLYNGYNGLSNVVATLYNNGKLEIDGTGNTVIFSIPSIIPTSSSIPSVTKVTAAQFESFLQPSVETNVPWSLFARQITEYEIKITVTPKNMDYWFTGTSITTAIIPNNTISINGTFAYCSLLTTIPSIPDSILYMGGTFIGCTELTISPVLPSKLRTLSSCFKGCGITTMPNIPSNVTNLNFTFQACENLVNIIDIPDNILDCNYTFGECTSLVNPPKLSKNTFSATGLFENCTALTKAPIIPRECIYMYEIFENCHALTGELIIQGVPTNYTSAFSGTSTNTGTNLTVNYIDKFSRIDGLISTKSSNSNITQGNYKRGTWNIGASTNGTIYDGTNGTNSVVATLQYDNNLYITGSGDTVVFTYTNGKSNAPWCADEYINFVESYSMTKDIQLTNMDYWFTNCNNLYSIADIPEAVLSLNSTFMNCVNLTGTSKIWSNPTTYTNCFNNAAVNNNFILNYADSCTNIDNIIATKSNTSKVIKGNNNIGSWNIGTHSGGIYSVNGNNSSSVKAVLKNDGTLVISGYGAITLFRWNDTTNRATTPWTQIPYCDYVRALQIEDSLVINNMDYWFQYCSNMSTPPAIPSTVTSMKGTFMNSGITEISNIPSKVTTLESAFENCKKLTGTGIINGNPTVYSDCFSGAATDDGTALVINYASSCTNIDKIIATKDATSHITKGTTV